MISYWRAVGMSLFDQSFWNGIGLRTQKDPKLLGEIRGLFEFLNNKKDCRLSRWEVMDINRFAVQLQESSKGLIAVNLLHGFLAGTGIKIDVTQSGDRELLGFLGLCCIDHEYRIRIAAATDKSELEDKLSEPPKFEITATAHHDAILKLFRDDSLVTALDVIESVAWIFKDDETENLTVCDIGGTFKAEYGLYDPVKIQAVLREFPESGRFVRGNETLGRLEKVFGAALRGASSARELDLSGD